ncbi:hypothetical protein ABZU76_02920 [Amycolatopsis sp. NPDC005232]|uniref:hypothetical protein n=1 Tax=Amycolatopsis sp. NPDC005232 TaxID=3157027 RepID=UPI0033BB2294
MSYLDRVPFAERTPERVLEHYHASYPLLAAYDAVLAEFNSSESIHEPSAGGLDDRQIARIALERIGLPPRTMLDIAGAVAFVDQLRDEMVRQCPPPAPNLAHSVIHAEYPWAGCVMSPDTFAEMTAERRAEHAASVAEEVWAMNPEPERMKALFAQALGYALPALYMVIASEHAREVTK